MSNSNITALLGIFSFLAFLIVLTVVVSIIVYYLSKRAKFDFTFSVGDQEKHEIRFLSERMWGRNKIYVDGVERFSNVSFFNGDSNFPLIIGDKETHSLAFQVKMPFLYGSYRTRKCDVYCDNKLIKTVTSGERK